MPIKFTGPNLSSCLIHLPGVGLSDDASKKTGRFHCGRNGQLIDLDFEVLREKLADEHRAFYSRMPG